MKRSQMAGLPNNSRVKKSVRKALFMGVCAALVSYSTGVIAQDDQQTEDDNTLEEVVVTGSRLLRDPNLESASPIATIDMATIQDSGYLTLEQTVNKMPQLRPDTTASTNQYGGPAMSADLRGVGAVRTLVLVDGRRFIPAESTGITDLATVPDMLVEAVDIVTGGASAVYGSDAIAGVVNFRLRDDFQGTEFRYQRGQSEQGDADTERLDFLIGVGTDDNRSNMALAISYSERDTVMGNSRDFSAVPIVTNSTGKFIPFGSGNLPGGVIALQPAQFPLIKGVDLSNSNGACPGPIQGVRFDQGSLPVPYCRPIDQYNYAADNFLLRPMERYQISAIGKHEINDQVQVYAQAFYNKYEQSYQMAPESVAPTSFGQSSGTVLIPNATTNPLFNDTLRNFWAQNGAYFDPDGDGNYVVRNLGRRFEEFGPRTTSFNIDSFMITTGLRGDLDFGANNWAWDAFYQFARNDTTSSTTGLLSRSGITLGLDPVINQNGTVSCRTQIRGCVPINIFGTNTLTPEMANYLQTESVTQNTFERTVGGATLAGNLFEMPAGSVPTAFGIEYRKESILVVPNEAQLLNDIASQAIAPTVVNGEYDLWEVFAEARLPILNDQFGLQGLSLEGAVRYSDYSTVGGVTTWSTMLDTDVNEQFKIRAGYSSAIRAPNLNELLAPVGTGFRPVNDPCLAQNKPSQATKDLCVKQGVPANIIDTLVDGTRTGYDQISGGNPNLTEEQADTLTVGLVWTPDMIPRLNLSLDYYQIKLKDAVSQVSGQLLLNDCFLTLNFNSPSCQSIRRDSNGNLSEIDAPLLNLADRNVNGVDLTATYSFDNLPSWLSLPGQGATIDISSYSSWQLKNDSQVVKSVPAIDCAGRYSGTCSTGSIRPGPEFRSLLRFSYASGPLHLSPEVNYIGELKLSTDSGPNENGTQEGLFFVNMNGSWDFNENYSLLFGVNNLFDQQPPIWGFQASGDLNVNTSLYDPVGRSYFLGIKVAL